MTRITDIKLTPINTPRTSGVICGHVIVELFTDDPNLIGVGEMSDFQHLPRYHIDVAGLESVLRELLVGSNILEINRIAALLEESFPQAGYIYDKSRSIKCGVDIALWDVASKSLGVRLVDLLGGQVQDGVPIAYPIFRQQHPDDIDYSLGVVEQQLQAGQSCFRVYVGRNLDLDERFLREARERFGDRITLKSLDFSNLLAPKDAARFATRVRDVGFDLVESPARSADIRGLLEARSLIEEPVSEHVYSNDWALELIKHRAVDAFNVSVIAIGGITPVRRVFAIAEAAGVPCILGTTQELSIGTAAAVHVAAATDAVSLPSDPVGPLLYETDVVAEPVSYESGVLKLPDGWGLGIDIDQERLAQATGSLSWTHTSARGAADRIRLS
ncbi:hypothetical protein FVO59_04020 [Microbacterium esteraromaticum]|uniref:Muconate cycloisomerase n=1 Tax=Microbacterium esteraromaticum TaxID=57043 RepID=A0A7D8AK60_9MICO|nr:enolase C-terminal domain-like protein [Microbacterium esteraromaticum]QMU96467.1 hypothetical protein FVO59_04020 [Microbacterium esteraromaticum]